MNSLCEAHRVPVVPGASDDAKMYRIASVQTKEVATIEGQHRTLETDSRRQD